MLLALLGAPAGAEAAAGVVVEGGTIPLNLSGHQVYSYPGATPTVFPQSSGASSSVQGVPLTTLLSAAGVSVGTGTQVSIDGSPLAAGDVAAGMIVATAGGSTGYLAAGSGSIPPQSSAPVIVSVTGNATPAAASGPVRMNAYPNPARVGETVTFSVDGAPPGAIYHWSYGEAGSHGTEPSHVYLADGAYPAAVTVTLPGQPQGRDASVTVQVGHPHYSGTGTGLGTSNGTGSGSGGTGSGRGGTGGGANTGAATGATQRHRAPKPKVRPAPSPQPGAAARAASARAASATSQPVRGVLLADVGSPLDLHLSPPPPSGSPGAAKKPAGRSSGTAAVIAGILLALAIVMLGGLSERRSVTLRPA